MTTMHAAEAVHVPPCPACGHQRWRFRACTCSHETFLHDIGTRKGVKVRTACSHTGPDGPCGCRMFAEAVT